MHYVQTFWGEQNILTMDLARHIDAFTLYTVGVVCGMLLTFYMKPFYILEFLIILVFMSFGCFFLKGLVETTIRQEIEPVYASLDEISKNQRRLEFQIVNEPQ